MRGADGGYVAGMSEYSAGQVDGPASGASDNAAENADPQMRDDVLGRGAREGVTDADRGLDDDGGLDADGTLDADGGSRAPGDTTQPRTGAETPVDAEDLVHARGQDVTQVTLQQAREDLDPQGAAAVEREVPDLNR
jgi:hypothetical protein